MDLHQLRTFVMVAREGSITRASERLHLSQPAVSAHIKAIEDLLGLALFDRTARGMRLTADGERLLGRAEETLAAHRALMAEAARSRAEITGTLRLGAPSTTSGDAVTRLVTGLAAHAPGVDVVVTHRASREVLSGVRDGSLDAGVYHEPGAPPADLATVEVAAFTVWVVAAPGVAEAGDWAALAERAWIYPIESSCCGTAAESLFAAHRFRPRRIVGADRQDVTLNLVRSGLGVGLLHDDLAHAAAARGEVTLLGEAAPRVRVLFAFLASRARDPILDAAATIMRGPP